MDVDELDKMLEMAGNVGTLNREEDKEEYKVIAMNEEEDPKATISINMARTKVMNNIWDGYVTREHVHAILFGKLIVDDKAKIPERVKLMKSSLPNMATKGDIDKVDLLFFVLFTSNHWHLLVVDVKKKRATSYNSIKGGKRYMAAAKRWVTLLNVFFKFCGIMDDPLELIYDDQCLDLSSDSVDCALFMIKFMETISRKGEIEWKFSQAITTPRTRPSAHTKDPIFAVAAHESGDPEGL
ncbi:hypothetical protein Taro_009545 [Colocasia esculenta]|uniref:Ubiquitin-like protease family profile domain-containing protein n=1 Tax=Colocasia esculenta TaxID=4460 RepID=A0A843U4B6_COLES|nr:hypothetical protein [Colocasia esculenta]